MLNNPLPWVSTSRYQVGDQVEYESSIYVNVTGANSIPSLETDWLFVSGVPDAKNVVFKVPIVVESADLLTLGTTSVDLIDAPGADKAIRLLSSSGKLKAGGTVYDFGAGDLTISYETTVDSIVTIGQGWLNSATDEVRAVDKGGASGNLLGVNEKVQLKWSGSNPTQGTGTFILILTYTIDDYTGL